MGVEISSFEVADTTSAPHVDSARDPKRSDPIPAISPTLSPTLSAMVPGLVISSSFRALRLPSLEFTRVYKREQRKCQSSRRS